MRYSAEQMKRMRVAVKGGGAPPGGAPAAAKAAFPKAAGKGALKGAPAKRDTGKAGRNPAAGKSASQPATKGN
jgi:hypothetical protein